MPREVQESRRNEAEIEEAGFGVGVSQSTRASGVVENEGKLMEKILGDEVKHVLDLFVDGEGALVEYVERY